MYKVGAMTESQQRHVSSQHGKRTKTKWLKVVYLLLEHYMVWYLKSTWPVKPTNIIIIAIVSTGHKTTSQNKEIAEPQDEQFSTGLFL